MPDAKKNIPILQSVSKTLREHCGIRPGDRLIVAVSAGSDSTALLHLLQAVLLDLRLTAVYIDHGLRPNESSGEIAQLRRQTRLLGIPLLLRTAAVSALQQAEKCSLEEAGRILRYQLLEEIRVAQNATAIATGHLGQGFHIARQRVLKTARRPRLQAFALVIQNLAFDGKQAALGVITELLDLDNGQLAQNGLRLS